MIIPNIYEGGSSPFKPYFKLIKVQPNSKVAFHWKDNLYSVDLFLSEFFDSGVMDLSLANVAIQPASSGLIVFDVDSYKGNWVLPSQLPKTNLIAETPRGGRHYYYRMPKDGHLYANDTKRFQNVDVKYNGYVLAPPSVIRDAEKNINGRYKWVSFGEPTELSLDIVKIIFQGMPNNPLTEDVTTSDISKSDYGANLLQRIISNGFTDGRHNEELLSVARYLAYQAKDYHTGMAMAVTMLTAIDAKDPTPQGEYAVKATVKSAFDYVFSSVSSAVNKVSVTNNIVTLNSEPFAKTLQNYIITAEDVPRYVIQDVLFENMIGMMVAPPASYKTWSMLEMLIRLGTEVNQDNNLLFGKYPVLDNFPVLLVQQEDYSGILAQRIQLILQHVAFKPRFTRVGDCLYAFEFPNSRIFLHDRRELSFDKPESFEALKELCKKEGIRYVGIDPFYSLTDKTDDYFASTASHIKGFIRPIRDLGVGMLLAHHTKKSTSENGNKRLDLYGSNLLNASVEWVMSMKQSSPTSTDFSISTKFGSELDGIRVKFDIDTSESFSYNSEVVTTHDLNENQVVVYQALLDNGDSTHTELCSATNMAKSTLTGVLNSLVKQGYLSKDETTKEFRIERFIEL